MHKEISVIITLAEIHPWYRCKVKNIYTFVFAFIKIMKILCNNWKNRYICVFCYQNKIGQKVKIKDFTHILVENAQINFSLNGGRGFREKIRSPHSVLKIFPRFFRPAAARTVFFCRKKRKNCQENPLAANFFTHA